MGSCEHSNKSSGSGWGISWLPECLLVSQEGLYSMELMDDWMQFFTFKYSHHILRIFPFSDDKRNRMHIKGVPLFHRLHIQFFFYRKNYIGQNQNWWYLHWLEQKMIKESGKHPFHCCLITWLLTGYSNDKFFITWY